MEFCIFMFNFCYKNEHTFFIVHFALYRFRRFVLKRAVVTEKCLGDPICFARLRCPSKAIKKSNRRTRMPIWCFKYSEVEQDKCVGCGNCSSQCQFGALAYSPLNNRPIIDPEKCFGCGLCRDSCEEQAIYMIDRDALSLTRGKY